MVDEQYDEETRRGPFDRWCVLIEETVGSGPYLRSEITQIKSFGNREDALSEAANLARSHTPQHPAKARSRRVFRSGEELWTVVVRGAGDKDFHFRVTVAKPETN